MKPTSPERISTIRAAAARLAGLPDGEARRLAAALETLALELEGAPKRPRGRPVVYTDADAVALAILAEHAGRLERPRLVESLMQRTGCKRLAAQATLVRLEAAGRIEVSGTRNRATVALAGRG